MEELTKIINDKAVGNTFFNLYDRWRDEEGYEDINEYANAIINTITKQFPTYKVTLIGGSKRPFGVKFNLNGTNVHLWVKLKGCYISLCAKRI